MTSARLVPVGEQAIRLNQYVHDHIPYYMIMLDRVRGMAHLFDIVHFHIDAFHMPLFRDVAAKTVTTLHGRQDLPELLPLYCAFPDMPLVSISDAQRKPIAEANFIKTVYHGLPLDLYKPNMNRGAATSLFSVASRPRKVRIGRLRLLMRSGCR